MEEGASIYFLAWPRFAQLLKSREALLDLEGLCSVIGVRVFRGGGAKGHTCPFVISGVDFAIRTPWRAAPSDSVEQCFRYETPLYWGFQLCFSVAHS